MIFNERWTIGENIIFFLLMVVLCGILTELYNHFLKARLENAWKHWKNRQRNRSGSP